MMQIRDIEVFDSRTFPYESFINVGVVHGRGHDPYANLIMTFDIETTSINDVEEPYGFMYLWTACVQGVSCAGRTWEDYVRFTERLKDAVGDDKMLVCWCHNLGFEFQFMRNFFHVEKVFAKKKRQVIRAIVGGIEYRCSYMLTNMGLDRMLKNTPGVKHLKQSGEEFDYSVKRYPDTELSEQEMYYAVCDTVGLYEALRYYLTDDDLHTIPLTSTGYVRRDFRAACTADKDHMETFLKCALNPHTYLLCKEAGRGALSGSSHIWTNEVITEGVQSFDITSSYPYQMMTEYFPQSGFVQWDATVENVQWAVENMCCLIVWGCRGLSVKRWAGIPYVSKARCRYLLHPIVGNGKVYSARECVMCCTEIDLKIIAEQYYIEGFEVSELWCARRGMLSRPFRETLRHMFQRKCELKGGDKYLYLKYKNKINSAYGMMLTDILNGEIVYDENEVDCWKEERVEDDEVEEKLDRYYRNKNSFLSYQHGVWVLAHARAQLYEGMKTVGSNLVQVDTDSVKCVGEYRKEFEEINERIKMEADGYSVPPYAYSHGVKTYLGVWDYEGTYDAFKTLGAKKYCTVTNGRFEITVAGLRKNSNEWLWKHGGMDAFGIGTVVPAGVSGRTSAHYNDMVHPRVRIVNGHEVVYGSNVAIESVSYTFGMTDEWLDMVSRGVIDEDAEII